MEILNVLIKSMGIAIYNILLFSALNMKQDKKKSSALISLLIIALMVWSVG